MFNLKKLLLYFTSLSLLVLCSAPITYGMQNSSSEDNKTTHQLAHTESWMHHDDVLKLLTMHLYIANDGNNWSLGKDLNALIQVNKALNSFYSNEQLAKNIIRGIAKFDKHTCENDIARKLLPTGVFRTIYNKINYLFGIIDQYKEFTENDLLDPWFIDATKYVSYDDQPGAIFRNMVITQRRSTLLAEACREGQLHNVYMLQNADVKKCSSSLLIEIAQERARTNDETKKNNYLAISQLLLEKQMDPDYRYWPKNPTALMVTVHNADKKFAKLLLTYNANPSQKGLSVLLRNPAFCSTGPMKEHFKDDLMEDAFHMEKGEPKGWLKTMVDEVVQDTK